MIVSPTNIGCASGRRGRSFPVFKETSSDEKNRSQGQANRAQASRARRCSTPPARRIAIVGAKRASWSLPYNSVCLTNGGGEYGGESGSKSAALPRAAPLVPLSKLHGKTDDDI